MNATLTVDSLALLYRSQHIMFGREHGSKTGSGAPLSSSESNLQRKERLRQLALETVDLANDPYFMSMTCAIAARRRRRPVVAYSRLLLLQRIIWVMHAPMRCTPPPVSSLTDRESEQFVTFCAVWV